MIKLVIGGVSAVAIVAAAFVLFILLLRFLPRSKEARAALALPLAVYTVLTAFFCAAVMRNIPSLREDLRLTALNEKSEGVGGTEIILNGIVVDDRNVEIPTPVEGKWFFTGSGYMWRPQTDPRQPEGTTDSIVLKIPVGFERSLLFNKGDWSGIVRIEINDTSVDLDTHSQGNFDLEHSPLGAFLLNFVYKHACYAALMAVFSALFAVYYVCFIVKKKSDKAQARLIYGGIALAAFAYMIVYSKNHVFWLDEIFQIGFSGAGKTLSETLMVTETTPPLFRLVANLWYRVAPYGEEWLLLLPEAACALSVYITGMLGETLRGRVTGILAAVYIATSNVVFVNAAYEFRSYGFLLLFSVLFLLVYAKRLQEGRAFGWDSVLYQSVCMILLAYTHYFGVFLCALCGLIDLILLFRKKISWRALVSYVIAAVVYIPWLLRLMQLGQFTQDATWMQIPSLNGVYDLFSFLCSNQMVVRGLFVLGAAVLVLCFVKAREKVSSGLRKEEIGLIFLILPAVYLACMYLYGTVINRNATLWVARYFIGLVPTIALTVATGGEAVIRLLQKATKKGESVHTAGCIVLAVVLFCISLPTIAKQPTTKNHADQHYAESADYLYNRNTKIFLDRTLVVFVGEDYEKDGFNDYYLIKQGKRDPINIVSTEELRNRIEDDSDSYENMLLDYDTIYVCSIYHAVPSDVSRFLNSRFSLTETNEDLDIQVFEKPVAES